MEIAVTGSTGFLGKNLIKAFVKSGYKVRALVRKSSRTDDLKIKGVSLVTGDITDLASLRNFIDSSVVEVYHAAGILGHEKKTDAEFWKINVNGTKNLIEACSNKNIRRLIHISSAGVIGPVDEPPAGERSKARPSNVYELTKLEAEKLVIKLCPKKRIPYTVVRPEFLYGPGDKHVYKLFQAIKKGHFVLINRGKSLLHPTYIDDFLAAIMKIRKTKKTIDQTYIIAGPSPLSVKEIAETIGNEFGRYNFISLPLGMARLAAAFFEIVNKCGFPLIFSQGQVNFFTQNRVFTTKKAFVDFGFIPQTNFKSGVHQTINWYVKNKLL